MNDQTTLVSFTEEEASVTDAGRQEADTALDAFFNRIIARAHE